ncbi:MAG: hypothetical protein Q9182_003657 [Xanthomendoza sp. 2 TL-2023]
MLPSPLLPLLLLSLSPLTLSTTPLHTRNTPVPRGINCRGSSQCSFTTNNTPNLLAEFNTTLTLGTGTSPSSKPTLPNGPIMDLELFFTGEHIICARNLHWLVGSICLFLQGDHIPPGGVPGFVIKRLVHQLSGHGCLFCGSVPVSEDNEPYRLGVLTSNYVVDEGCQGVCGKVARYFLPGMEAWMETLNQTAGGGGEGGGGGGRGGGRGRGRYTGSGE